MLYGTRAVMEAIEAGRDIDKVLIQSGLRNDLVKQLIDLAKKHNVPVAFVPPEKLTRMSTKNHQGVLSILSSVSYGSLENIIDRVFGEGREPFLLILDRITDVRNFGGIVRAAECAGMDAVVIAEKGNAPVSADAMKTSGGALNHVEICREKDLKKTVQYLRESGLRIIACTEKAEHSLFRTTLTGPIAILMGSEEDGISDVLLREADDLVQIPMKGKINSLNVSVAAGIAVFEVVRQRGG